MNSLLRVTDYARILRPKPSDRDEDVAELVQRCIDSDGAPPSRFDALKALVRRKRKRPTALTPLSTPPSPTPYITDTDEEDESEDQRLMESPSPRKKRDGTINQLPPLAVQVLERKKLFLNPSGEPFIGIEEIIRLQEEPTSPPKLRSPLQLIAVPRKIFEDDEVALMPCHTLHYRYIPSLEVERWREPVRDRDKNWREDELGMILTTQGSKRESHLLNKMTRGPSNLRKGTWRRLDSQQLQVKTADSSKAMMALPTSGSMSPRDTALTSEVLLRSQGAMISRTYCIVTIYGIGIYGRLYSEGVVDRPGYDRHLRIDAYDPQSSTVMSLKVSMNDLAWVFESNPALLTAGKKQSVLKKVVALLYIQYPYEDSAGAANDDVVSEDTLPLPPEQASPRSLELEPVRRVPVLCISPEERINEAARRRLEREERLRREEQERLRLLALLMKLPKRARHRILCTLHRVSGHEFIISIYHFPTQVRNFLVVAYHPRTSRMMNIAVGVQEAAGMCPIRTQPHKWTVEQKQQVARALVPMLHLCGSRAKAIPGHDIDEKDLLRVSLAVREDRKGAQASWLPLPLPPHSGSLKDATIAKYKKDRQQELQLAMDTKLHDLDLATSTKMEQLRRDIKHAESTIVGLKARDAELKEMIEDINSGKGIPTATIADEPRGSHEKQQHHEVRRTHKAARKMIKDESKVLQARIVAWKRELELTKESDLMEREKLQSRFTKAVDALTQIATTATLEQWFDPHDRKPQPRQSEPRGNRQHTAFHKAEIQECMVCVVSGACRIQSTRFRYSVFAELGNSESIDTPEWFHIMFYDADTSDKIILRLTRLELISFAKKSHDAQLQIPMLAIDTSPERQKVAELDAAFAAGRAALTSLSTQKKHDKKRAQLTVQQRRNRQERGKLWHNGVPWHSVIKALCDKLSLADGPRTFVVDRCIYKSTLTLASISGTRDEDERSPVKPGTSKHAVEDEDAVVDCEVSVSQDGYVCTFHARDLVTNETWSLEYPESDELVKEFAVESQLEQHMHLEAIALTLLLYTEEGSEDGERRQRKMRFEE